MKLLLPILALIILATPACKKKKEDVPGCATVTFVNQLPVPLTIYVSELGVPIQNTNFTEIALSFPIAAGATVTRNDIPEGARKLRWEDCQSFAPDCTPRRVKNINYSCGQSGTESVEEMNGSDFQFKKDFEEMEATNITSKMMLLKPLSYEYDFRSFPNLNAPHGRTFGFIAQDIEKLFPEAVLQDKDGFRSVSYTSLIPVLTTVVQQQQKQIELLTKQIEELKK